MAVPVGPPGAGGWRCGGYGEACEEGPGGGVMEAGEGACGGAARAPPPLTQWVRGASSMGRWGLRQSCGTGGWLWVWSAEDGRGAWGPGLGAPTAGDPPPTDCQSPSAEA